MARFPRTATDGTWHHVMNRGARRLPIFGDDRDRYSFLTRLEEAHERYDVEFHAYALMRNHFHLLVQATAETLGRTMQLITGLHARRHNARYGLDGPLFRGRYRSKPITDDAYLRHAVRYIHRNPLEHGDGSSRALRWTSHPAYSGAAPRPRWLRVRPTLLSQFGGSVDTYTRFIFDGETNHYEPPSEGRESDDPRPCRMMDVESAVGVDSGPERALLTTGGRGVRNDLRLACVLLAHEYATPDVDVIGRRYGFSSASTVRSALARARTLASADEEFAEIVRHARLRLHTAATAA